MSIIKPFKKTPPVATAPARARYNEHKRTIAAAQQARLDALNEASRMQSHITAGAALATKVETLRAAVDEAVAAAFVSGAALPADLEAKKNELAAAEAELASWQPISRGAEIAHRRLSTVVAERTREAQELTKSLPRVAHAVLAEDQLAALAAEFLEKEQALREVHRRVFVIARAADKLAVSEQLGDFRDSATFLDLFVSRPAHPAFRRFPNDPNPTVEHQASVADNVALDREADLLVNDLLYGEGADA
jgi:hypothetical protein